MATAGIAAEYSPSHQGHTWRIVWTRQTLGADTTVICVISGHWVQRGKCALTDKWSRVALVFSGGAGLVLELPTPWAVAPMEVFIRGVVSLLTTTGVMDVLFFGSETGELTPLRAVAVALDGPDYPERLRAGLARGLPFPTAWQAVVGTGCLASPSGNLGVEYLRTLPPDMEVLAIPRRRTTHDGPAAGDFASASELRVLLRAGRAVEVDPHLPAFRSGETASMVHIDRVVLARLRTMDEANRVALPDGGVMEGLPARLVRSARTADSPEDFYARAKAKRYPHARLWWLALATFLGLWAAGRPSVAPYARVLGLSGRGRVLLCRMKETRALPMVVKLAQARALDRDARALSEARARRTDLFDLCPPTARPCGLG